MSIRSLADFNGSRPSVGPVLARTDTVTGRGTPAVDHVNEVGTFDGHTRGLSHGHGQGGGGVLVWLAHGQPSESGSGRRGMGLA